VIKEEEDLQVEPRVTSRFGGSVVRPSRYMALAKVTRDEKEQKASN